MIALIKLIIDIAVGIILMAVLFGGIPHYKP